MYFFVSFVLECFVDSTCFRFGGWYGVCVSSVLFLCAWLRLIFYFLLSKFCLMALSIISEFGCFQAFQSEEHQVWVGVIWSQLFRYRIKHTFGSVDFCARIYWKKSFKVKRPRLHILLWAGNVYTAISS